MWLKELQSPTENMPNITTFELVYNYTRRPKKKKKRGYTYLKEVLFTYDDFINTGTIFLR